MSKSIYLHNVSRHITDKEGKQYRNASIASRKEFCDERLFPFGQIIEFPFHHVFPGDRGEGIHRRGDRTGIKQKLIEKM